MSRAVSVQRAASFMSALATRHDVHVARERLERALSEQAALQQARGHRRSDVARPQRRGDLDVVCTQELEAARDVVDQLGRYHEAQAAERSVERRCRV